MTRRALSYHSDSQRPPYDYLYEERRYGTQAIALIRKAGSDRGLKSFGSFGPSRLANPVDEENFADEYSNSKVSNYSTSSASSPYRSSNQSPNFTERGIKISRSSIETSRERVNMWNQKVNTFSDTDTNLDEGRAPYPQVILFPHIFISVEVNWLGKQQCNYTKNNLEECFVFGYVMTQQGVHYLFPLSF